MPDVIAGRYRRPLALGRSLFDYADELAVQVPASCRRTGRCHECVVEVRSGAGGLTAPTEPEGFLRPPFRLACQATLVRGDTDVEFAAVRRRLRILASDVEEPPPVAFTPVVTRIGDEVRHDGEPIDRFRGHVLGLAIDVGTTTVVAELVDLESGAIRAVAAFENPQRFGGSDVMNRISYDAETPGELRRALVRALNLELRALCASLRIDRREIYEVVVVGNATMRDLFFGLDVQPIGQKPYKSIVERAALAGERDGTTLLARAHELGIWAHPQARIYGGPLIASHVGADVAADLLEVDIEHVTGVTMLVDVGTNTEVVIGDGQRFLAASCPAGPAFEGGLVRYGMQGADGAIESIRITPTGFEVRVIGGHEPQGICGSGLIDILAELRRHGRMTPLGAFADRAREIAVVPEAGITFSREDASSLAQAKAANACGQMILMRAFGVRPDQVDRLWLAGGFASHVDVRNAIDIGFLAPVPEDRISKIGNASIRGARLMLLDRGRRTAIERLVRRIEHVELETSPDFFDLFVDGCQFTRMATA